jgi:hypothetical protein
MAQPDASQPLSGRVYDGVKLPSAAHLVGGRQAMPWAG